MPKFFKFLTTDFFDVLNSEDFFLTFLIEREYQVPTDCPQSIHQILDSVSSVFLMDTTKTNIGLNITIIACVNAAGLIQSLLPKDSVFLGAFALPRFLVVRVLVFSEQTLVLSGDCPYY